MPNVQREDVEALARKKWEAAGKPEGRDTDFYYAALNELEIKTRVKNRESCRDIFRSAKMHTVEYEPQVRVCKFHIHGQMFQHYLAFPYMQFTRYLGTQGLSLHVSFTKEPLKSIEDDVYFPPLPNVWYPSLQVCLMSCPGTTFELVMRNFWETRYLDCEDWYCFPVLEHETPMKSYKRWEVMTLENPAFILEHNWTHPCKLTEIPLFDVGGSKANGACLGNPKYGGGHTNRHAGPIRGFAVVKYGGGTRSQILD